MSDVSSSWSGSTGAVTEPRPPTDQGDRPPSPVTVTVRYFAAARAAAGCDDEAVTVASPATVGTVVAAVTRQHGQALERVLTRCSYLLNATAVHELDTAVGPDDRLDVLPPFAGG